MEIKYRTSPNDEARLLRVRRMAIKMMKKHGLMKGKDPWMFDWSYAKTQLGHCDYNDKVIRLSKWWMMSVSWEQCLDTILHEIAHALIDRKHGHDKVWKQKCREIGAIPKRCYEGEFQNKRKELNYNYPDINRYRISS